MTYRDLIQDICAALSAGAFVCAITVWASYVIH
ncbi:hypothetical protein GGE67_000553 [Rhizobium leucaenae]|nr:hypothetical protein [Rhizobium leucaenae]